MNRLAFPLVLIGLLAAGGGAARDASPNALILSCSGPFARDSDAARLAAVFGAANLRDEEIAGAEGEVIKATVIYPDDPTRRIEIAWSDEANRRHPATIRVHEDGSQWRIGSVGMGSTLDEVAAANGAHILLSGFGWDYGGLVTEWNEGALPKLAGPACRIEMDFAPQQDAPDALMGDGVMLDSNDPAVRASRPVVTQLGLTWPDPGE
jgi:hypothetical protein